MQARSFSQKLSKQSKMTLFMLLFLIVLIFAAIWVPNFTNPENIRNVMAQMALLIIVGAAVTLLLITGNLDLSVGAVVAQSGVLYALFCQMGMSVPLAMALGILSGVIIGLLNAFLVVRLGIVSVLATLGTMSIARGIAYIFADGSMVEVGLPPAFRVFQTTRIGPFQIPDLVMVAVVILFVVIQAKTIFGQKVYYIGANPSTARLSGVRVGRMVTSLYTISGLLAGTCGVMLASKLGAGDCKVGAGYEFDAVVASVLGGTSIVGGEGSILGMVVGMFILGVLNNALNLMGIIPYWQQIIKGIVLIVAILAQRQAMSRLKG